MAEVVEQGVVQVSLDDSGLTAAVEKVAATLETLLTPKVKNLDNKLKEVGPDGKKSAEEILEAIKKLDPALGGTERQLARLQAQFKALGKTGTEGAAGDAAVSAAARRIADYQVQQMRLRDSIQGTVKAQTAWDQLLNDGAGSVGKYSSAIGVMAGALTGGIAVGMRFNEWIGTDMQLLRSWASTLQGIARKEVPAFFDALVNPAQNVDAKERRAKLMDALGFHGISAEMRAEIAAMRESWKVGVTASDFGFQGPQRDYALEREEARRHAEEMKRIQAKAIEDRKRADEKAARDTAERAKALGRRYVEAANEQNRMLKEQERDRVREAKEAADKIADEKIAAYERAFEAAKIIGDQELQQDRDKKAAQLDAEKRFTENVKALVSAAFQVIAALNDAKAQREEDAYQRRSAALEAQRANEIAAAEATGASTVGIEAKYKALQNALGKKHFEEDKSRKKKAVLINTAAAAVSALAEVPWWGNLVAAGLAIAMGAIQYKQIQGTTYTPQAHGGKMPGRDSSEVTTVIRNDELVADPGTSKSLLNLARFADRQAQQGVEPGSGGGAGGAGGGPIELALSLRLIRDRNSTREIAADISAEVVSGNVVLVASNLKHDRAAA